jgi:DNA polymerase-3 subunit epsilon
MRHLIFDTETTDLLGNSLQPIAKQARVFEIFGLLLDDKDWSEVMLWHVVLNPQAPLSAKSAEMTGMTDADLVGKPLFSSIADDWSAFLGQADVVVAHNLKFDRGVIDYEFKRLGKECRWPPRGVCTVEQTEQLKGHRLSLMDLHMHLFGEGFEKAHSAEHDVRATARCYVELVKRGEI